MKFQFAFKANNGIAYPMVFHYINNNVYQLYFYGFSVDEIVIYTSKYSEFNLAEQSSIIERILRFAELKNRTCINKYDIDAVSDVIILANKLIEVVVETLISNNSKNYSLNGISSIADVISCADRAGLDEDNIKEIVSKTFGYVDYILHISSMNTLYASIKSETDILKQDVVDKLEADNKLEVSNILSIRGVNKITNIGKQRITLQINK
jgi:hypothetical protein